MIPHTPCFALSALRMEKTGSRLAARLTCIPLASLRQYEMARYMPPPAVRAYLKVIEAEPEVVRKAVAG